MPAGQKAASFSVATAAVSAGKTATLTAQFDGAVSHVYLSLVPPPALQSIGVNPLNISSGGTATGTVTLNQPAAGAVAVTLASSDTTAATVPASVNVRDGARSASFNVHARTVSTQKSTTISATCCGSTQTKTVTVQP